ncbi:MAG TPA: permease-like cell division protein FtsX [Syntrophomonadaceae bacterium]|nr:permease-like cell division protein FtsX [Syntrophomonadaceae bacterium]
MRNIIHFFREAFSSLRRNKLLTLATITTVSICIMILGAAVLITMNASQFMDKLESDVEIVAYIDKTVTGSEIADIKEEIQKIDGVRDIKFVSCEAALKDLQKGLGKDKYNLEETLEKNPLPDSYQVSTTNPHDVPDIAVKVEEIKGISKVNYGQGFVERLFEVTKWVRIASIIIIALLSFGAIFLIATTIRLAIFARRKEIYLMKLIGATDWFVRWPFFIEGVILGSIGSLIAIAFIAGGYQSLINNISSLFFLPLVTGQEALLPIYITLLVVGAVLGVLGTLISLNRFLDV